jgi:hypothetical protein
MPKLNRVRDMSEEEVKQIRELAHSRTKPAALVTRAQLILMSREGMRAPLIAEQMRVCGRTVRRWIERFNAQGIEGLLGLCTNSYQFRHSFVQLHFLTKK